MTNRLLAILLSILALATVGCAHSEKPQAASFPSAHMQRMQSVQHWDVLAGQLSKDLAEQYGQLPPDMKHVLYIDAAGGGVFSKSLKSLLITHLVGKGVPIVTDFDRPAESCRHAAVPCQPLVMKMDVQVVKHDGINIPFPYKDVSFPKIASYVIYFIGDYWTSPAWAVLPLSEYIKNEHPSGTNTEIIVNTSLLDGDNVVSADSSLYYVNDNDAGLYQGRKEGHGANISTSADMAYTAHAPYNMEKPAIGAAAREGGCYYAGSTKLIQQRARMQTYKVHCRNHADVTVQCEEYDHCHVVFENS